MLKLGLTGSIASGKSTALKAFAERAYRRPLSGAERDGIAAFYRLLREQDGLGHDFWRIRRLHHFFNQAIHMGPGCGVVRKRFVWLER